jgi:virginiamycin B lyase
VRKTLLVIVTLAMAVLFVSAAGALRAQTPGVALTGTVTSAEEGAMEGVLVSAKLSGSNITTTVVSDAQGHYSFPAAKLGSGAYALSIRAAGYDLDGSNAISLGTGTTTADLRLKKTSDLAAQLSNADWLNSMPGTPDEKRRLIDCMGCHTIFRVVTTHYTANQLMQIIPLMSGYAPGAQPLTPDRRLSPARPQNAAQLRSLAEYIASINLSTGSWKYPLKTHPRPSGRATHAIITEYDLPRALTEPHDVILDAHGMAWYSDFGAEVLGELDPRTGAVTEYPLPLLKPHFPAGSLDLELDKSGNIWMGMMLQGGIAEFDPKTKTFKTFPMPTELNDNAAQIAMVDPLPNGQVITNDVDKNTVHLLDPATNQWQTFGPFKITDTTGPHSETLYGVLTDAHNNAYALDFSQTDGNYLGKVDYQTKQLSMIPTPTKNVRLRRGHFNDKNQLTFAEFAADQIGMFDANTGNVTEWKLPTVWSDPYDAIQDKHGEVWTGNMSTDLITRLDSKTGKAVEYMLPRETNVRRVFVDNTTNPVTFWTGSNHGASIIKLEPGD